MKHSGRGIFEKSIKYYLCIFTVIALCYGFTLTHFSIGVDDEAFYRHFYGGNLIRQGRWFQPMLAQIIPFFEFLPFWRDFLALVLWILALHFMFNGLNDCAENRFDENAEIIFICASLACTFRAYAFIFAMTTLATSFTLFCQALTVKAIYCYTHKRGIKTGLLLFGSVLLSRVVSEGTTMCCVTSGGFALLLVLLYDAEKVSFKQIFRDVVVFLSFVLVSMVLYNYITDWILHFLGQKANGYTENYGSFSIKNLLSMCSQFPSQIVVMAKKHTTFAIYLLLTSLSLILGFVKMVKERNITIFVAFVCWAISPLFIYFITGNWNLPLRILVGISLFFGEAVALLYTELRHVEINWKGNRFPVKNIMLILVCGMILNQSCEMNRIFFNDYLTYQRDLHKMESIYEDILKICDGNLDKTVCFVGVPPTYSLQDSGQEETTSIFLWDRTVGNDFANERIVKFFNMHGLAIKRMETKDEKMFHLKMHDEETIRKQAAQMPIWPQEGSVCDFGDYIIVNLYSTYRGTISTEEWENILNTQSEDTHALVDVNWFDVRDNVLVIRGWAIIPSIPSYNVDIKLYLVGEKIVYVFDPSTMTRTDVTGYVGDGVDYDYSGFSVTEKLSMVESGCYQLILGLSNKDHKEMIDLNHLITVEK